MQEFFNDILANYSNASKEPFKKHPLANTIREVLPDVISDLIADSKRYQVTGSAGQGTWATIPWVAIFDVLVTTTAQSGYYPVFLFREDMAGVFLSLNQGVTDISRKYRRDDKDILRLKAEDYRAQLKGISHTFNVFRIQLGDFKKSRASKLAKQYEAGNIIAKYYSAGSLPTNEQLRADILEILRIYRILYFNHGLPSTQMDITDDEERYKGTEDLKKYRQHKRLERNRSLAEKAKKSLGYRCKVCDINFEEQYGEVGKNFIEAHHLTPISKLEGDKIQLDVRKDFTVLCANCHRMIHRLDDTSNIPLLKSLIIKIN